VNFFRPGTEPSTNGPRVKRQAKLGRVVTRGFVLIIATIVLLGVWGYWADVTVNRENTSLLHLHMMVQKLTDLETTLFEADTGARNYVITGKEEFYEPFFKLKAEWKDKFAEIHRLFTHDNNEEQAKRWDELEELARKTIDYKEQIISTEKAGKHNEAIALIAEGTGIRLMDESKSKVAEIIEAELQDLDPHQRAAALAQLYSTLVNLGGTLFAGAVGLFLLFSISRQVVLPIRTVTSTIASATTEIAATVEQHEKTALHQSASVNETTTTIEELEHSFRQMDEAADAAGARANQAILLAENGSKIVAQSLAGVTDLKEKVGAIAEQILRLSEQTSQIGAVISLVSDLADQTNMLALNAAVEAARAGDHGKGFAVVAAEIRKLADQSRKSTEKVNTLVADIRKATDATVMVTEEGTRTAAQGMELAQSTAEAFNDLKSSLNTIIEGFQQTQLNINQQMIAVKQVTQAMEDVNLGTKETNTAINHTKEGVQQLKDAVEKLNELV
jgi:methyl-accepting chemotaxis protein